MREKTARRFLNRNKWKLSELHQGKIESKKLSKQEALCKKILGIKEYGQPRH